ncbi:hypothetical protein GJA_4162 [Janthinobacterium agaricidamnosum NBRC 102515 = DSM 9628]|uniref:Uncharacterized protein n=1 Tax=Janthinobacterium agaricidamnosum NBRC 102515 = DSM 9628 TaxID=1349767 RepID=W0VBU9_9BURK|nr:hypothetical protein GJA_4162 [Janthinobacterium agaricidamnosum NBRC 102515 = DSM 9628]
MIPTTLIAASCHAAAHPRLPQAWSRAHNLPYPFITNIT